MSSFARTLFFRYVFFSLAITGSIIFHSHLPFDADGIILISSIALSITFILNLFSRYHLPSISTVSSLIDIFIAPFFFYCSGGFISPFIIPFLVLLITDETVITSQTRLLLHLSLFSTGYLTVAFLQKGGILPNVTAFSAQIQSNTRLFIFVITFVLLSVSAIPLTIFHYFSRLRSTVKNLQHLMTAIVKLPTDETFFDKAATLCTEILGMRTMIIARCSPTAGQLETKAIRIDSAAIKNCSIPIEKTYANELLRKKAPKLYVTENPADRPMDPAHIPAKTVVLAGHILRNSNNEIAGVLYATNSTPVVLTDQQTVFFEAVSQRISSELERSIAEEKRIHIEHSHSQMSKMDAVGKLASVIAHDFNNVISAISGYASLIKKKLPADDRNLTFIDHILEAGKHASGITSLLAQIVKYEQPHAGDINLDTLLQSVCERFREKFPKIFNITCTSPVTPQIVNGDPVLLQNVLLQIGMNACDACTPGSGEISFIVKKVVLEGSSALCTSFNIPAGNYAVVEIRDNGSGIDDGILERIFEPYFSTRPKDKWTGLGLSFVWNYVVSFNGALEVSSAPGHGTVFRIYLPAVIAKSRNEEVSVLQQSASIADAVSLQPQHKQILIVDDEPSVRDIYSEILSDHGYTVHTCKDGMEAVLYIETFTGTVDLVLLDMVMPRMGGPETFSAIRAYRSDIKILLMSGIANNPQLKEMLKVPGAQFFQKPCDDDALLRHVKTMLESG